MKVIPVTGSRERLIGRFVRDRSQHLGFLRVLCRDAQAAEELFQELSIRVIESIDSFDEARDFGAWIRGIARNIHRKAIENRARASQRASSYDERVVESVLAAYETRTAQEEEDKAAQSLRLKACLDRLPDHQRRLIWDRYQSDFPMWRIARLHQKSVSAVETILCRLRALLLKCLERQGAAA